jgi:hypothetical protein
MPRKKRIAEDSDDEGKPARPRKASRDELVVSDASITTDEEDEEHSPGEQQKGEETWTVKKVLKHVNSKRRHLTRLQVNYAHDLDQTFPEKRLQFFTKVRGSPSSRASDQCCQWEDTETEQWSREYRSSAPPVR